MSPRRTVPSESPWFYPTMPRAVSQKALGKPLKGGKGSLYCPLVEGGAKVKFWGMKENR